MIVIFGFSSYKYTLGVHFHIHLDVFDCIHVKLWQTASSITDLCEAALALLLRLLLGALQALFVLHLQLGQLLLQRPGKSHALQLYQRSCTSTVRNSTCSG